MVDNGFDFQGRCLSGNYAHRFWPRGKVSVTNNGLLFPKKHFHLLSLSCLEQLPKMMENKFSVSERGFSATIFSPLQDQISKVIIFDNNTDL